MTEPWVPPIPGLELGMHYVHVSSAPDRYEDRRVVIVGKRNSAFEVGEAIVRSGLRELTLVSPRPPDLARLARSPLRPWYLTPYDEHVRGAPGRYVLNASVERIERRGQEFLLHALDPTRPESVVVEVMKPEPPPAPMSIRTVRGTMEGTVLVQTTEAPRSRR